MHRHKNGELWMEITRCDVSKSYETIHIQNWALPAWYESQNSRNIKNKRRNYKKLSMKYNDYLHSWLNAHCSAWFLIECASKCSLPWQNSQINECSRRCVYSNVMLCFSQFTSFSETQREEGEKAVAQRCCCSASRLSATLTIDICVFVCRFVFLFHFQSHFNGSNKMKRVQTTTLAQTHKMWLVINVEVAPFRNPLRKIVCAVTTTFLLP